MLVPLLLASLATTGTTADPEQDPAKGAALMQGCQAELRLMQPDALATAQAGDLVNGAYCIGYLNGFLANVAPPQGTSCLDDQPMASLVQAYVNYMQRNPQLLQQEKRIGLRLALESSYPCPSLTNAVNPRRGLQRDRL